MLLILKPDPTDKTPNRFVVLSDGVQVGRIFDRVPGASAARNANWCWTIAGKYCRDCGLGVGGDAATREDAIAAFRKTWDEHATFPSKLSEAGKGIFSSSP
jgi:hypothetical protein